MNQSKNFRFWSKIAALVTTTIWGVSFIFSKIAFAYADPIVLLAWRFALAFGLMTIIKQVCHIRFSVTGKPVGKLLLLGIFEPIIYFICENYGVLYSTATFSGVMIALVPISALICSTIFLKERPTLLQAVFSVLSVAGVLLMSVTPGSEGLATWKGAVLMTGAVLSATIYLIIARNIAAEFTPFERTYCMFLEAFVFFALLALISNRQDMARMIEPWKHDEFLQAVLFLGILSSIVAFFCQNFYVTYLTVAEGVVFSNLVTVVSIVSGVLILHDPFTLMTIPASILIIGGVVGVQLTGRNGSA